MLRSLGKLRALMLEMESSLGLLDLSQAEKDVLYAIGSLYGEGVETVRTEAIRAHPLVRDIPPATFHRALRSLLDKGLIALPVDRKAGVYVLSKGS